MNLFEMANHVCQKIGKTDPESVEACKGFIRRRHELSYSSMLFKDSLDVFDVPAATGPLVVLPVEVGRPLALWEKESGMALDLENLATVILRDPMRLQKGTYGTLSFSEGPATGWPYPLGTASQIGFVNHAANPPLTITISGAGQGTQLPPVAGESSQTLTVQPGLFAVSNFWQRIDRMTRQAVPYPVPCYQVTTGGQFYWPADMEEVALATVRLVPPMANRTDLQVYGKKRFRQMQSDGDSPMVRGLTNALLAFAQGDMLERGRQYSKAAAKSSEGTSMLTLARDEEVNQSAFEARVIPQVGAMEGTESWLEWE
jgi:hypothetical protein